MTSVSALKKKAAWVVVADESSAIVYARDNNRSPLHEEFVLTNDAARRKTGDLISDRGGRSFDSFGAGRHTMEKEKSDPKRQASIAFAKEIAGHISAALQSGDCSDFSLIAPPRFLGLLRNALKTVGNAVPLLTIDKDIVGQGTAEIEALLADRRA